jgi:hypothetical protein
VPSSTEAAGHSLDGHVVRTLDDFDSILDSIVEFVDVVGVCVEVTVFCMVPLVDDLRVQGRPDTAPCR